MTGIYIHIPFCRSKCSYCDFVSYTNVNDSIMTGYISAVCEELRREAERYRTVCQKNFPEGINIDSIYIGGGTPSLLEYKHLIALKNTIKECFSISDDCEFSIEANPDTVTDEMPLMWKDVGINRISLGLQTADDKILKQIGRRHNYEGFFNAVQLIEQAGLENISFDLMLGLPSQDKNSIISTLDRIFLDFDCFKHASIYALKVERGTALYPYEPDEELCVDMYNYSLEYLDKQGFRRYEISNVAREGYECRHNKKYWNCDDYLGIGIAAHGFYNRTRTENTANLKEYLSGNGRREKKITSRELAKDYLMLSLRTAQGMNIERYEEFSGDSFFSSYNKTLEKLNRMNLISIAENSIRINPQYFYVSNSIILEFF